MEGPVLETSRLILTKFTDETITISALVMIFLFTVLVTYWLYNRRKFRKLTHQIPASVVKNYLDSIIQNSTSLKSSLFRGGGLELGDGIPSVVPVNNLPTGGASPDEINQKNAEIARLNSMLADKSSMINDLEAKLASMPTGAPSGGGNDAALQAEITNLKGQLTEANKNLEAAKNAAAAGDGGGDAALQQRLDEVTKERDDLKERLMEYEIIEEDLANLKRLQQENEELKKALQAGGGTVPEFSAPPAEEPASAPEPEPESEPEAEPEVASEPIPEEDDLEAQMAAAIGGGDEEEAQDEEPAAEATPAEDQVPDEIPAGDGEQKSADELLSEFEKMLG